MLGKMKDLYNLQKQAKAIKKELKATHIEAEVNGIIVIVNGEMDIVDITIPEFNMTQGPIKVAKDIKEAFEKGKKKAEQIAAEKMKAVMGGGFPGLGGGE